MTKVSPVTLKILFVLIQTSGFGYFILHNSYFTFLLTHISGVFTHTCFSYASCRSIEEMFVQCNVCIHATRTMGREGRIPSLSFPPVHHFRRFLTLQVLKSLLKDQISAVELVGPPKIPKRNSRVLTLSVLAKVLRT